MIIASNSSEASKKNSRLVYSLSGSMSIDSQYATDAAFKVAIRAAIRSAGAS
jgi:hypothetical protein